MSPGITLELHWWRGYGPTVQHDLFFYGWRFGFFTLSFCKVCLIESYAKLRETAVTALDRLEKR